MLQRSTFSTFKLTSTDTLWEIEREKKTLLAYVHSKRIYDDKNEKQNAEKKKKKKKATAESNKIRCSRAGDSQYNTSHTFFRNFCHGTYALCIHVFHPVQSNFFQSLFFRSFSRVDLHLPLFTFLFFSEHLLYHWCWYERTANVLCGDAFSISLLLVMLPRHVDGVMYRIISPLCSQF